nr:energy-coupling factor transporter transmembrane component T [Palleronia pontilimi]
MTLTSPVRVRAQDWPAGGKLAALSGASVVLFAVDSVVFHGAAAAATLALFATGGRRFAAHGLRRMWALWPFVAVLLIWNWLDGAPVQGIALSLRLLTAVGLATLVTMTTQLSDMMAVVRWLAHPLRRFGVTTRPLELAVALVIRFTPALARSGAHLAQAWRARSGRRASWRIVAPLAVLALDDAERVADALRARGGLTGGPTDGT